MAALLNTGPEAPTRPVLRWHGGKWRLAPWIISHFPAHRVYVEPFGGAASVLLQKTAATTEIYNDLEDEVVHLFRVIREHPQELAALLNCTPFSRTEYHTLYVGEVGGLERARRFVARSFMGQSSKGALSKSGFDTRINPDGFVSRLNALRAVSEEIEVIARRMARVIIEHRPALRILSDYDRADALFYLDPPYLGSHALHYTHELTDADHAALLDALKGLEGMVVLSGYPHPLYDDALAGWRRVEKQALADGARPRTEVLWINPAATARLEAERAQGLLFEGVAE